MIALMPLLLAGLLSGCACSCPVYDTAQRVAERDFSKRADPAVLRCKGSQYVVSVKAVE